MQEKELTNGLRELSGRRIASVQDAITEMTQRRAALDNQIRDLVAEYQQGSAILQAYDSQTKDEDVDVGDDAVTTSKVE